jgi:serine/threonine protein kinase
MTDQLRIYTLGNLSIQRNGTLLAFETQKEAALLVYLACTNRTQPREVLAEMLWEDLTQSQCLANLQYVLAQLRRAVAPFVVFTPKTVAMNTESDWWFDVTAFEADLATAGERNGRALESALELYKGDFLAGFSVDSQAFEEWARLERERLRLRAMAVLDKLITYHLGQQDYTAGIACANRLLGIAPLREKTHRQLMKLLVHSGQRGKALEQYEMLCQLLTEELGIKPTSETTNLYEGIKVDQPFWHKAEEQAIQAYELFERIGVGAFGEVYRAYQPTLDREVAIKVIRADLARQPKLVRWFETEARIIARLEHINIVPLYDYWREPEGAYIVMRWLPFSLEERLEKGPLTLPESVQLVEQISAALVVAHQHGVVHRDLKPANILLDDEGNAYLADFGLAKDLSSNIRETKEGEVKGALSYLSPEQIQCEPVTPLADIYSLGIVLYEILTGQHPFGDVPIHTMLDNHLHEPLPLLCDVNPSLPRDLDIVIQRATAKEANQRYPDALSLATAFREAAGQTAELSAQSLFTQNTPVEIVRHGTKTAHFVSGMGLRLDITSWGHHESITLDANEMADFSAEKRDLVLGRYDPVTGSTPDIDLTPYCTDTSGVSRLHVALRRRSNNILIVDLGSVNGTYLNSQRIGVGEPSVLCDGDVFFLGKLRIQVFFLRTLHLS